MVHYCKNIVWHPCGCPSKRRMKLTWKLLLWQFSLTGYTTSKCVFWFVFVARVSNIYFLIMIICCTSAIWYRSFNWPGIKIQLCDRTAKITPHCLGHLVFSKISPYNSYLPLIFGTNASIWGYFQNVLHCRFWGHWGKKMIKVEFWGCKSQKFVISS